MMVGSAGSPAYGAAVDAPDIADSRAVDAPSAVEFMREALIKISEDDIGTIADLLVRKRELLLPALGPDALAVETAESVRPILARVFATRRRSDQIVVAAGAPALARAMHQLVHGPGHVGPRFRAFDEALPGIEPAVRRELASECLHLWDPERHWLWSRWMWDPDSRTGALPLVMVDAFDFDGADVGAVYLRVGTATAAVIATADELGFRRMRANPFVVDVYLAAIYGVYLYTVTRLRMTQEFNRVIPQLPDLVRRLLGVYRLEA